MKYQEQINDRKRSDWEQLIDEWVHNETDRTLLKRRLLDGVSLNVLWNEINDDSTRLSIDQMKKRLYKAQKQLFKHA